MLAVYSFASILQVILWNTWAPIAETGKLNIELFDTIILPFKGVLHPDQFCDCLFIFLKNNIT